MTPDHRTIEELLAVQALGGLDGDDVQALANERSAHGECAECARLEAEFSETAGRLGFSLDPLPVDPAMADRILAVGAPARAPVVVPDITDPDHLTDRRARRTRGWQAAVGVAAVIAVLVVAVSFFGRARTTSVVDASPTQRLVAFTSTSGADEGELAVAFTPGEPGAVIWGSNLPDPGQDKVYELWMIQDGTPIPGGCFTPEEGRIALRVDANLGSTEAMALTAEPADCPSEPTGTPVATADLAIV